MKKKNLVTVGVRFHDLKYFALLKRCLMSIAGQEDIEVHTIVCTQGFNKAEQEKVAKLCKQMMGLTTFSWEVLNVPSPGGLDIRSKLLNKIVKRHYEIGKSSYLSFIDYDDIWFSHALRTLISSFDFGRFALSYADIHCANVYYDNDAVYLRDIADYFEIGDKMKIDLFANNFLPLHSYLFNTSVIKRSIFHYDQSLKVLEDYDFLLLIARQYPISGLYARKLIGLYNFYTSRDTQINTTSNIFDQLDMSGSTVWNESRLKIYKKHSRKPISHFIGEDWRI